MNSFNKTQQNYQQSTNYEKYTTEKEVDNYNRKTDRIEKMKIQIQFNSDQKFVYSQKGVVLRIVQCHNLLLKQQIFNNVDQIRNLSWEDQQGQEKSIGKLIAFWNIELLKNVGGYHKEGQKQGLWKDLFLNFQSRAKIFEIGEYHNDLRIGKWIYIYIEEKIGGGFYNKEGQKQGKWIEIDEGFYDDKKVAYNGEYNMNSIKVGRWDILYCKYNEKEYKQIGIYIYKEEEDHMIKKWVELDEEFRFKKKVTYIGEYNMNGMKVGRWDKINIQLSNNLCGCINFDEKGNEIYRNENLQIVFVGSFKNSMKIGRWDILYCKSDEQEFKQIGGGSYDKEGNQKKIGNWVELDEGFNDDYFTQKQVTYNGEYNKNGMKVGRWDILYCKYNEKIYKQIGGGSYDKEGNQKKIGRWIELDEGFQSNKKVIYNGEYNMNGMKVGRWAIMYCKSDEEEFKQIGGGTYDQEENQIKIGEWIELDQEFNTWKQVTHNGQYNMKGLKVGSWVDMDLISKKKGKNNKDN